MAKVKKSGEQAEVTVGSSELAQALVAAIEAAKPKQKKTAIDRVPLTPWTPTDGSPKLKLRRKMTQHGMILDPDMLHNSTIELLNKLKIGTYMNGTVRVTKRKDNGIDFTYPVKTAAQRLRLVNQFGITDLDSLLRRCVMEAENPKQYNPDISDE